MDSSSQPHDCFSLPPPPFPPPPEPSPDLGSPSLTSPSNVPSRELPVSRSRSAPRAAGPPPGRGSASVRPALGSFRHQQQPRPGAVALPGMRRFPSPSTGSSDLPKRADNVPRSTSASRSSKLSVLPRSASPVISGKASEQQLRHPSSTSRSARNSNNPLANSAPHPFSKAHSSASRIQTTEVSFLNHGNHDSFSLPTTTARQSIKASERLLNSSSLKQRTQKKPVDGILASSGSTHAQRNGNSKLTTTNLESATATASRRQPASSAATPQTFTSTIARRRSDFRSLQHADLKAEDVRLDLRGQNIHSLDINLTPRLEFVYLRDNKLSSMVGLEVLKRVKILDLSFNEFKSGDFQPLSCLNSLQQLYLAGNQIASLKELPELPNLEFLSVAQNQLKSMEMPTQPKLQVLAASDNQISTFKGFPHLPVLEHIRLENNPILDTPHAEAATILIFGGTLKRFNNRDISIEEQTLAKMYPAHTALCLREGWEFRMIEEASGSTLEFLVAQWKDKLPPGYTVKRAGIDTPYEEDCCNCCFVLEKEDGEEEDSELALTYQWYIGDKTATNFTPIEGATNKAYWPRHQDIGCCLKVECTPIKKNIAFPSIFAISSPVAAGTGCPKVLSLKVVGELIEGKTVCALAEVAWCGGTPAKAIVSWLRRHGGSSPVAIMGAEEHEYQLSLDDVGANLLLMYTPVTEEGVKGESQFATTDVVEAALPSVEDVRIIGSAVEGMTLKGIGKYFGGREGASKFDWFREDVQSGDFNLISLGTSEYKVSKEDVGSCLMFSYTPINMEGIEGSPVSTTTGKVLVAPPKVTQLKIVGDIIEGNVVSVSASIVGGGEEASRVQWFKTDSPVVTMNEANLEAISSSKTAKEFRIPVGAVGLYLAAKYTPSRCDGECGEPVIVISDKKVEMLPPCLTFLSLSGEAIEGETLTASYGYVGGHEGKSEYTWFIHKDENDPGVRIQSADGQLQYKITIDAVGKLVSFRCTPVRVDGMVGESRSTLFQEYVKPGLPMIMSLKIRGDPIEGAVLILEKNYWGGFEGPSNIQWFLAKRHGPSHEIMGATALSYKLQNNDIGSLIYASCDPVRSDDIKGATVVSPQVGPVVPGPPMCKSLKICGHPVEGGSLTFEAMYSGGEKGNCIHAWYRRKANGKQDWLTDNERLDLTSKDVGCHISLVYTPVRIDGVRGSSVHCLSDAVANADPVAIKLSIPDCCEAEEVIPKKSYYGGTEGASEYRWYRVKHVIEGGILPEDAISLATSSTYFPTSEDVGMYIALSWFPVREDGKRGMPLVTSSTIPVAPAMPTVRDVKIERIGNQTFCGHGKYHGGLEGSSIVRWYREMEIGSRVLIEGATSVTYVTVEDDYTCCLVFGYTPVREDGAIGTEVLSEKSDLILPDIPKPQKLLLNGKAAEGEVLNATGFIFENEADQAVWQKYKKDIKYQWYRSRDPGVDSSFDILPLQRTSTYKIRSEDVGFILRCECTFSDIFNRNLEPVVHITSPVLPGVPKIDKLEIEGQGYHTNLYAVRGIYSGGKEGKSMIQWFRAMSGRPDLLPIAGEAGRMYEANVDDVGCRLVAVYTPVRDDGVGGAPVSASTDPIAIEPEVAREVKQKLELGAVKFEALRDREQASSKGQQQLGLASLERRVLDVNKKRFKVVKPGTKTSFPNTEIRGSYVPPFRVEIVQNDQHRLKIVVDNETEVDLMVQRRALRDVIVLVLRGFAQKFGGADVNPLLF